MRPLVCIFALMASMAAADPVVLDRFETGADARWRYIGDNVMGGVSSGQAQISAEGLNLTGQVSTDNNGGFIQVRREFSGLPEGSEALILRVRGNGARYTVFLRTRQARLPWHNYKASFVAGSGWSEVRLELSDFERSTGLLPKMVSPEDVKSIGLAAYGADYQADLWVGEVRVE